MSRWPIVKLGQVAEFINGDRGKNYPSGDDFVDNGIPFINTGHLVNGSVDFSKMNYIRESHYSLLNSGKTRPNDILYCLRGSLGKTAIVRWDKEAAIASSLVIIRPSNECNVDYLYHFLSSPLGNKELSKFDNGSSQPNLSATSVKNYNLPLPPLPEQKRIAAILDKADSIRRKRQEAVRLTDDLLRSVFLEMFGDPVTNPKGWDIRPLGQLIAENDKINYGVVQPGDDFQGGIPVVRVGDFNNGSIDISNLKTIDPTIDAKHKKSRLVGDEVLIACVGSIGAVAMADESFAGFNIVRAIARVRPNQKLLKEYLANYLLTPFPQSYFTKETRTVSQPTLNISLIEDTLIMLPPINLQNDFVDTFNNIQVIRNRLNEACEESVQLFSSLLQNVFHGEELATKI